MQIKTLSEQDKKDINRLLNLELDEVYAELAQDIGDLSPGDDLKKFVDNWLYERRTKLYDLICTKHEYCTFISKNKHVSLVNIAGAVADIIVPLCYGGIPINALSVLLIRSYLDNLCNCNQ